MKSIILGLFGFVLFMLVACDPPRTTVITYKNEEDSTGYAAARNLKGLASFKISETTYNQALRTIKDEIRKDYIDSRKQGKTGRYNSYSTYRKILDREDFGDIKEFRYDTLEKYLENSTFDRNIFGCPSLKVIEMFDYFVGEINVRSLELNFFNDTLYRITAGQNDEIEKGFKEKYGGHYIKNNKVQTPFGIKNEFPDSKSARDKSRLLEINEKYIWENETLIAVSHTYLIYRYEDKKSTHFSDAAHLSRFYIETKNTNLLNRIKECENLSYKAKTRITESKKKSDYSKL